MGLVQMAVAKGIVATAFRNGPLEDIHAGKTCPTCQGDEGISHITQDEMKALMKYAVDHVYALLMMWQDEPEAFGDYMARSVAHYTMNWDGPENTAQIQQTIRDANDLHAHLRAVRDGPKLDRLT